ncbi:hypothetical protein OGATHE_004580 [Ogataea polymorpha]|uniref:Uncharacterized protein n=1 Tax=Ogataea polymorpha TaxID=460523 RepID=A0A9P8T2B3_9ASCO|nr:hypothetical protein OGATHE_004580 [Ogataea polymorpha]
MLFSTHNKPIRAPTARPEENPRASTAHTTADTIKAPVVEATGIIFPSSFPTAVSLWPMRVISCSLNCLAMSLPEEPEMLLHNLEKTVDTTITNRENVTGLTR